MSEEGIEIEGYGLLSLDPAAAFYKGYGNYGMQKKEDILVGYDLERFSLKDGRICGVNSSAEYEANKNTDTFIELNTSFVEDENIKVFFINNWMKFKCMRTQENLKSWEICHSM